MDLQYNDEIRPLSGKCRHIGVPGRAPEDSSPVTVPNKNSVLPEHETFGIRTYTNRLPFTEMDCLFQVVNYD